jgi:Ca2+-transporting ATPase
LSLLKQGLLGNPWIAGAVLLTVGLQFLLIYIPVLQNMFQTVPLRPRQVLLCAASAGVIFVAVEIEKWVRRLAEGHLRQPKIEI